MELYKATIRPGKILEDLGNGLIKAEAPGLFSRVDQENLPPIYPASLFFGSFSNQFSSPVIGDECIILSVSDNPLELFWFRKDHYAENEPELLKEENIEIICNRAKPDSGWATLYFSDGSGWILRNGDPYIQLDPDGNIILDAALAHRCLSIGSDSISLGTKGGSAHPAAYGDVVQEILEIVGSAFNSVRQAASSNAYTANIAAALSGIPEQIKSKTPSIVSDNVTLD